MDEKRPTVLIVDDDESIRDTLEVILQKDYTVLKTADGRSALQLVNDQEIQIVLLDLLLPDLNGLEVLQQIKDRFSDIEVIMITAVKEVGAAVQAMKLGAYHYITKSFDYDEILALVGKVVERQRDARELLYLRSEIEQRTETEFITGRTKTMQQIHDLAQRVARLPATVLILGESGTGKQLLARFIHKQSGFAGRPFVTVDLGAIPETLVESNLFGHEKGSFTGAYRQHIGKFELADGGTLFLDEIGNLRQELQAKLLRVIQEGEIERVGGTKTLRVAVRLISATNVDLAEAVQQGAFREDLYYRLNVIPIKLPPLRERIEDLPQLVEFFLQRYNKRFKKNVRQISPSAMEMLSSYDWPGNIRELENLIERLVALSDGDTILCEHIPIEYVLDDFEPSHRKEDLFKRTLATFERNFILKMLEKERWNRSATARTLGIPVGTLRYKMSKLKILDRPPKREG
ncbi:MAG: sigma-54-dependent Fis family transcriptional regulator [Nitrospirae bacterium]|nr:sigma-54-dependent Fis family transcriptional regulator [Nitrospirota bacterium]